MEQINLACGNAKLWMSWFNKSWILLWKTNLKGCQTKIKKRLIDKLVAPFVCVWPRIKNILL